MLLAVCIRTVSAYDDGLRILFPARRATHSPSLNLPNPANLPKGFTSAADDEIAKRWPERDKS
eukprot:2162552-Rhodomonas_salina.2